MFNRILVALDGSALAEAALAPAIALAEKFGGEVILLRVTAPELAGVGLPVITVRPYYPGGVSPLHDEVEAGQYLEQIRRRWSRSGVELRTRVRAGSPAETVVETARQEGADLIAMSTHGRSGLDRLVYGSVAEAVLRGAHVPVLLVPLRK